MMVEMAVRGEKRGAANGFVMENNDSENAMIVKTDPVLKEAITQLKTICSLHHVRQDIADRAWELFRVFWRADQDDALNNMRVSLACVIFVASLEARMSPSLTTPNFKKSNDDTLINNNNDDGERESDSNLDKLYLMDVIRKSNIRMSDFFEKMKSLKSSVCLRNDVLHRIVRLQRRHAVTAVVYAKFERVFTRYFVQTADVFRTDSSPPGQRCLSPDTSTIDKIASIKSLCWALFVTAKGVSLYQNDELVPSFCLLLCCFHHILQYVPSFILSEPLSIAIQSDRDKKTLTALDALATSNNCTFEQVIQVYNLLWNKAVSDLNLPDALPDFQQLRIIYLRENEFANDVNELRLLDADSLLSVTHKTHPALTSSFTSTVSHQKQLSLSSLSNKKYLSKSHAITPISSALSNLHDIHVLVENQTLTPSAKLEEYFKFCVSNPEKIICDRVEHYRSIFINYYCMATSHHLASTAESRYDMASKLYYKILQCMLEEEEVRLKNRNFCNILLHNVVFHKSLLSCSMEVILVAVSGTNVEGCMNENLSFPWVLKVFDIKPYDFFKVIESFIKAEPGLPDDVVSHLQKVQTSILDNHAWKMGSPLVLELSNSLKGINISSMTDSNSTGSSSQPIEGSSSSVDKNHHYLTRSSDRTTHDISAQYGLSPRKPPSNINHKDTSSLHNGLMDSINGVLPIPNVRISKSVRMFLNRVCKLGYQHIEDLCQLLRIDDDIKHKIWLCLEHIIKYRPELMLDRHLDQMVLCSVYAVYKILEKIPELKFKAIVMSYRSLPYADDKVYKMVLIAGQEKDTIIGFYNKVFIDAMKLFVHKLATPSQGVILHTPRATPLKLPPSAPSVSIVDSGKVTVYLSPMKEPNNSNQPPIDSLPSPGSLRRTAWSNRRGSATNLRADSLSPRSSHVIFNLGGTESGASATSTLNSSVSSSATLGEINRSMRHSGVAATTPATSNITEQQHGLIQPSPAKKKKLTFDEAQQ